MWVWHGDNPTGNALGLIGVNIDTDDDKATRRAGTSRCRKLIAGDLRHRGGPAGWSDRSRAAHSALLLVLEGNPMGLNHHPDLLETNLVEDCNQPFNRAAQISDSPVEGLDLLLQMRDALVTSDYRSQFLTTVKASADSPQF